MNGDVSACLREGESHSRAEALIRASDQSVLARQLESLKDHVDASSFFL